MSVVIPTYNRARHLPDAIASVFRQGHSDVEVIVIDDGSEDETREVVAAYGDRVRYVYQQNRGVGSARNTGIRLATKEFVAFLDSDDRWRDHKLTMQLAVFRSQPLVGMVFTDFVIEKLDGTVRSGGAARWVGRDLAFPMMQKAELTRPPAAAGQTWPAEPIAYWYGPMYRQLLDELPILTSSVIVRRASLDATTYYAETVSLFEDWEFFARVARKSTVAYLTMATTVNRAHADPGRLSHRSRAERAAAYLSLLERVWLADGEFVRLHSDAARSAHGRALLALAREVLLEGRRTEARTALAEWRSLGVRERRAWARVYETCAQLTVGPIVLRQLWRARTASQLIFRMGHQPHGSVNPAA